MSILALKSLSTSTNCAQGNAVPHLKLTESRTFELSIPPIELQREFARRVRAVEKLKTAQRASLAELDALFASLQHRAFACSIAPFEGSCSEHAAAI